LDKNYTQNWLIFGLAKILTGISENVVCALPFFLIINYVHAHYIYTNIKLGFETFMTKNKFKKN
jgi:hypothetical protein